MRVRRDNGSAAIFELLDLFLRAQDSPYRRVDGERVPWLPFVDDFCLWSGRQHKKSELRAAIENHFKGLPIGEGSKGVTFLGNVANGHSAVKKYTLNSKGYMVLDDGKAFTPRPLYIQQANIPQLDPRLVKFVEEHCRREGEITIRKFLIALTKHLGLKREWNMAQTRLQLTLLGLEIDKNHIIHGLSLLE